MRKLWVKAWITLDGVFVAETMDHWWQNTDNAERMAYIMAQYAQGDSYLIGRTIYEMLWPGWSQQTTGEGPGPLLHRMHKYVISTTLTECHDQVGYFLSLIVAQQGPVERNVPIARGPLS